ncbi:MAG TPA: arginine deiminase-related protein, partial [Steroidobacteraceae bacterium]|nr:arginine deiminase-related protein [Steroidobacteraceae bacterium]
MVRPARFAHNNQTAGSNRFQQSAAQSDRTAAMAAAEFDALSSGIAMTGVAVCCVDDTPEPPKPDAAFPNNWVSFHRDGTVVMYPMLAPNRRAERRPEILSIVEQRLQFRRRRLIDLSVHEREGRFLEGTGSLVLDHTQRIAYACRSGRTDEALVRAWSQQLGFEPLLFDAAGPDRTAIYHTNVLLSVGTAWAVVCTDTIAEG